MSTTNKIINDSTGILTIAATPIGNLKDVSLRFIEHAKTVDAILCEDTRHASKLLNCHSIKKTLVSLHEFNERNILNNIVQQLLEGKNYMLISDAGTPLIQDPGYNLVRACLIKKIPVITIPGPCALIAALSISGISTEEFVFKGYLPKTSDKRIKLMEQHRESTQTAIYYATPHKILAEIQDALNVYGDQRTVSLIKEITKLNEKTIHGNLLQVLDWLNQDPVHCKGEFVFIVEGKNDKLKTNTDKPISKESLNMMTELLKHLPLTKASKVTAKLTNEPKTRLYQYFIQQKEK